MKFKTNPIYYIFIFFMAIFWADLCNASDVSINFTGNIKSSTCNLSSTDEVVVLGDVSTTNFNTAGDLSPATPFSIIIDCPVDGPDNITISFSGRLSNNPELFDLDAGDFQASGVAVRINEASGTLIKPGSPSAIKTLLTGVNTLTFQAQYQSLVDRSFIKAGTADSTVQFTIDYP